MKPTDRERLAVSLQTRRDKRDRRRPVRLLTQVRSQLQGEGYAAIATRIGKLQIDLEDQITTREKRR